MVKLRTCTEKPVLPVCDVAHHVDSNSFQVSASIVARRELIIALIWKNEDDSSLEKSSELKRLQVFLRFYYIASLL
ncbi:unnamed protein product [Gongylonema pulchrum]|uniref:SET domain-containing protein n=1 Tax=Gongylonema pulchrum TaxID=637853 RepID=A0A183E3D1_9BILA|nr:unnamed protein product [Gongylonema pulchrum]